MWINKTHAWEHCLEQQSPAFASSGHLPCALLQVFPTLPSQVHCPSPRLAPLSKASSHSKSSWRTCHAVSQPATLVLPGPPAAHAGLVDIPDAAGGLAVALPQLWAKAASRWTVFFPFLLRHFIGPGVCPVS